MDKIVEVNHLRKSFGKVKAVDDVSFSIEEGKIYGLLGRNGAGKTTLMHILTAQSYATTGDLSIFGEAPFENDNVLSKICFIKESQKYPDHFSVSDVLSVASFIFPDWDQPYASSLIKDFKLPLNRRVKKLSRGMLSAVGIVVGLASRAPLTIFDEPYTGLDVVARSLFYDRLIEDYAEHPRTVILSTHLIDEVSQLLEHVMVIDQGKLIINEDADSLRGRAFTVAGVSSKIEEFSQGKNILDKKTLGGLVSATFLGNLEQKDRDHAKALGLEPAPISIQQLIIHLTGDTSERKEHISL
ncbi:ABC transporter ATP-binding protein [Pseudalkalibacillus sp. R45]|uniref:ABC transporter ATP-binding protein n=1 Tax=Pseudalkalibacillus sp. R45 TaxID=3457433 RepID=UPI003FCC7167